MRHREATLFSQKLTVRHKTCTLIASPEPPYNTGIRSRKRNVQWGLIHSKDHEFIEYLHCTKFCTRSGTSRKKETQLCPQGATRLPGREVDPQHESTQALCTPVPQPWFWGQTPQLLDHLNHSSFRAQNKPRGESEGMAGVQSRLPQALNSPVLTTLKPGARASHWRGIALCGVFLDSKHLTACTGRQVSIVPASAEL